MLAKDAMRSRVCPSDETNESFMAFLDKKLGVNTTDPWNDLINKIHNDKKSTWDNRVSARLGSYVSTLNRNNGMQQVALLVREAISHLALEDKEEQKRVFFNQKEWDWARKDVDIALQSCVFLSQNRGVRNAGKDRETLKNILNKSGSPALPTIYVTIPGMEPQKVTSRLLNELLASGKDSDISRLIDLFYKPAVMVWAGNRQTAQESTVNSAKKARMEDDEVSLPLLPDLIFSSAFLQAELVKSLDMHGDTVQISMNERVVSQRALEWLNNHAHNFPKALMGQVDEDLAFELILATNFLKIPPLPELCLRILVDRSPNIDGVLERLRRLPDHKDVCLTAFRQLGGIIPKPGDAKIEPVSAFNQLYREMMQKVRTFQIPVNSTTRLSTIFELIQQVYVEKNLLLFFDSFRHQILNEFLPNLTGNRDQNAATVLTWMNNNSDILDQINELTCVVTMTALPGEIKLFTNLQSLDLSATQIRALPTSFNPPNLEFLVLHEQPIIALPEGFNPPKLKELYLQGTKITSFPRSFNPPQGLKLMCAEQLWNSLGQALKAKIIRI